MTFAPADRVEVYDGDEDAWFVGAIEDEAEIKGMDFWVVRLDDGPVQFGMQVRVMAVPFDRPEWIRAVP